MLTPGQIAFITDRQNIPRESAGEGAEDLKRAKPILFRRSAGSVRVTIFDGGHDLDIQAACDWPARQERQ
jgi:hypothetical protein